MAKLHVELVSPEREIWAGEADMVVAKTIEGEMGILPGHAPVLGEQFISAVDQAIILASNNPLAFQVLHRSVRRVLLRRFPYALFFAAEESRIVVLGVLHQARNPRVAQRRR